MSLGWLHLYPLQHRLRIFCFIRFSLDALIAIAPLLARDFLFFDAGQLLHCLHRGNER